MSPSESLSTSSPTQGELDPAVLHALREVRAVVFDFDGVFTDNTVYTFEDGHEAVRSWRGDGLGLRKLEQLGIPACILSTEVNAVVASRAAKLGIPCRHGLADKTIALREVAAELRVSLEHVAYLGNDINDASCLQLVGLPVAVRDAHPDVLPLVRLRTRTPGGFGAVRELCDLIWIAHGR